jgi:hypothetical protein
MAILFLSLMRPRIEFATAVLSVAITSLRENIMLVGIALGAAIPQVSPNEEKKERKRKEKKKDEQQ